MNLIIGLLILAFIMWAVAWLVRTFGLPPEK